MDNSVWKKLRQMKHWIGECLVTANVPPTFVLGLPQSTFNPSTISSTSTKYSCSLLIIFLCGFLLTSILSLINTFVILTHFHVPSHTAIVYPVQPLYNPFPLLFDHWPYFIFIHHLHHSFPLFKGHGKTCMLNKRMFSHGLLTNRLALILPWLLTNSAATFC